MFLIQDLHSYNHVNYSQSASTVAARLQSQLSFALQRLDRISQAASTKLDNLSEKLEGVTSGMVDRPLALLQARLDQLEDHATDLSRALIEAHVEHERDVSSMGVRSAALLARYERDLNQLRSQMDLAQEDAKIQVAALQKALDQAVSKAELLAGQLLEAERKLAEAEQGAEGSAAYLRTQHQSHISVRLRMDHCALGHNRRCTLNPSHDGCTSLYNLSSLGTCNDLR